MKFTPRSKVDREISFSKYHKPYKVHVEKRAEPISLTYLWAALQWNAEYGDATCLISPCEKLPSYWMARKGSESEKGSLCARRDDHKIARLSSSIALGGYPGAFIIMFFSSHWGRFTLLKIKKTWESEHPVTHQIGFIGSVKIPEDATLAPRCATDPPQILCFLTSKIFSNASLYPTDLSAVFLC